MRQVMLERFAESDCAIMAAAVADFTVAPATEKLKKDVGTPTLEFVTTRRHPPSTSSRPAATAR